MPATLRAEIYVCPRCEAVSGCPGCQPSSRKPGFRLRGLRRFGAAVAITSVGVVVVVIVVVVPAILLCWLNEPCTLLQWEGQGAGSAIVRAAWNALCRSCQRLLMKSSIASSSLLLSSCPKAGMSVA